MARPHTNKIDLTQEEREKLEKGCHHGNWKARKILRARFFLLADVGERNKNKALRDQEIADRVGLSKATVGNLRRNFQNERLGALEDKYRCGRPKKVDGELEAQIIALACSQAPQGRERWTLRLMADKLVELVDELEYISYTTIGKALKKMN